MLHCCVRARTCVTLYVCVCLSVCVCVCVCINIVHSSSHIDPYDYSTICFLL